MLRFSGRFHANFRLKSGWIEPLRLGGHAPFSPATGQPTEDTYDRVDYYFTYKGKKAVVEIKVRNAFYSDYLIEADKLQALEDAKAQNGLNGAYYVCFYKNQMYIFSTKAIKQYGIPQRKYCKRTTMGMDDYILKDVILVSTDKAARFDFLDGRWQGILKNIYHFR